MVTAAGADASCIYLESFSFSLLCTIEYTHTVLPNFHIVTPVPYDRKDHCLCHPKASERKLEGGRKWKELSVLELGVWLGIVIYMAVHNSPAVRDYWRHDGRNPTHPICDYMGQARFEEIKEVFPCAPTGSTKGDAVTARSRSSG